MAEKKKYNSILISGRKDQTLTYSKYVKDEESGESVKESLDKKVNVTDELTTQQIKNGAITNEKLAADSVGNTNLQDGSVSNDKLENGSITNEKVAENSITKDKLQDKTIGVEKLDNELRQAIAAATGLPEDLVETIQNVDDTLKDHQSQLDNKQSQIDDKQQQITANDEDISLLQTRSTQMEETIKSIAATGGASQATAVTYNNEKSKLTAVNIQSAVDEVVDKTTIKDEEGNVQDTPFRVIENEEFIIAVVDSEDKVLYGIYRKTGKPYCPQNDMYHISQSEEFLWVILDAVNHPLLGILQDGTCWAAKAQWLDDIKAIKEALSSIDETLKTFQPKEDGKGLINLDVADSFFYISNDEYIIAVVDAENRILAGIKYDGQPYFPNHEMYSVIANEEWLYAIIDAEDKVLCGFRANDGHMIVGGIDINTFIVDVADIKERTAHLLTIENDEYLSVETDSDGKVIGYTAPDGSHYLYKVKSETIPTEFSHIEDPEGRTEITTDAEGKLLGYRDSEGTRHEEALDVKKYLQGGVEYQLKNFAEKKVLDNKIQELDLKDLNGVKDHSRRNLLDPSKCTPSYNDGENTYSPPNAGYILSNPIECKAGDIFTRTGTATGMVVVSDKDDKNARRLMPNGQLPGSTLQIPFDWTWVSFIRFAVQKSALSDLIISKGTYTISKEESGNFCTIDNLKIQAFNLSNDVAYIKATDGKYFELYIDAVDNYSIKARQVDITVIQPNNLPSDWVSFTYSGTFNGLFDRFVLCNNKYLFELKETGVTKLASIGNNTYMYHNAEHFYNNKGESRYATILRGSKKDDTVGVGFCLFNDKMELIVKDLGFMGNTIDSKLNWIPDSHDFIYIDDGHYLFFFLVSKEVNVPNFGTKTFTSILINEVKKINGIYKVIGSFDASDYPKLFTDIYLEKSKNLHMNTLALDYDNNLIVNFRDANSFIKIRRVEKEDDTVIIGSETKDYNEAVIGRVGGYRNIGYLDSKRVLPNGFSFSDVPTGLEVSSDPIEDWQWYHCHDVKYWGMKEINGKNYPTYTLFDNNYWTSESYGDSAIQNPRNNYTNNPKCNGWSYESANGNDEDYKAKTVSRIIQISIDWDNSKIVDYKIYEIPEYFSQEMCGATMLNEGILAIAFSYMGVWGVYDFISELGTTTIQTDKIYKGAKKLFEAKYDTLRYCYRSNIYKLK